MGANKNNNVNYQEVDISLFTVSNGVLRFVDKFSSPQSGLENLYKSGKWLA